MRMSINAYEVMRRDGNGIIRKINMLQKKIFGLAKIITKEEYEISIRKLEMRRKEQYNLVWSKTYTRRK